MKQKFNNSSPKTNQYQPKPNLPLGFHLTQDSLNEDGTYNNYQPVFSNVFHDADLLYGKYYEVLPDEYGTVKDDETKPLLAGEHIELYCRIARMVQRGNAFQFVEMSMQTGVHIETLYARVDRLEDCELVTRVRCLNKHGRVYLMVHTPRDANQLKLHRSRLWENIKTNKTANLRKELGKKFPVLKWDMDVMQKWLLRYDHGLTDLEDRELSAFKRQRNVERKELYRRITFLQQALKEANTQFKLVATLTANDWLDKVKAITHKHLFQVKDKEIITAAACLNLNLVGQNILAKELFL